jgi:mRNA-degrading endonuclease RelE of RelBE toxin-antitoxin system
MKIKLTKMFKHSLKKIKKHHREKHILELVLDHIKNAPTYQYLRDSPMSKSYGFERLKHELNAYHSFSLCSGRGGKIRLIVTIDEENNSVELCFISYDHYADFIRKVSD